LKRKICVYTATRAEYGLLQGVLKEIKTAPTLQLQILASGMHLSPEFGMTIQEIRADGFEPDETIEILLSSDTPTAICKSMGLAMIGYGEALQRLKSNMVVVLGDRFETFCMAAAAHICRVPLAHIHGGETTEGAIDEAFRHSITKMSHLHFASCEEYRRRIIQLGESPERVFNVGALGVETLRKIPLWGREDLTKAIGFAFDAPFFLVTFHPVTLEIATSGEQFKALLSALRKFSDYKVIFTKANADTDGRVINRMIDEYCGAHSGICLAVSSLGAKHYLSVMNLAEVVIGNSSSGIIEAPSFKIPTVNIGDRQKGRLHPPSVIDCQPEEEAISTAINRALSGRFKVSLEELKNPYEKKGTAQAIKEVVKEYPLKGILKKKFYDLPGISSRCF